MDKKMIYIVVAVLIVVIIVGVAAVMLLNQGGGGGTTPTPTPAPVAVADATSLQFTVTDSTGTYNYFARGLKTSEIDLAIQYVDPAAGFAIIFDGKDHKSWSNMTGTWAEGDFTADWDQWYPTYEGYVDSLVHWTQGNWTSTDGQTTISNIAVNANIDPACFEVPAT